MELLYFLFSSTACVQWIPRLVVGCSVGSLRLVLKKVLLGV